MSPRAYRTTWGWYSSQSRSRSSSWLQNGCLTWEAAPVLKLGIHPAMERPAILNRSIPSTTGATMRILLATKNAIYTIEKEYARWRAVSPGSAWLIPIFRTNSHISPQKSSHIHAIYHQAHVIRLLAPQPEFPPHALAP